MLIATGNTGKHKVIHRLKEFLPNQKITVLDIGVGNLDLWLDCGIDLSNITIYGIDKSKQALEDAKNNVKKIKNPNFHFSNISINEISEKFSDQKFDIIVSTNVLEHLKDLSSAFNSIRKVMKNSSIGLFVCDSGHFSSTKNTKRKLYESAYKVKRRYFDDFYLKPPTIDELKTSLSKSQLSFESVEYYNIDPIKFIHNHLIKKESKDEFAKKWFELELFLNKDPSIMNDVRQYCATIYFETRPIK